MKKQNAFIFSALGLTLLAVAILLIIFGIKGELAAFFNSSYGTWTIVAVVVWTLILVFTLSFARIKKL